MSNLEQVKAIYAAFGRGDMAAILECLADDVAWEYGATPSGVPWLQPRSGRAGAAEFFASLGGMQIHHFSPTLFLESESGAVVIVLVNIEFSVIATGQRVTEEDEVHIWHFNDEGKVVRFRHRADTLAQQRAVEP